MHGNVIMKHCLSLIYANKNILKNQGYTSEGHRQGNIVGASERGMPRVQKAQMKEHCLAVGRSRKRVFGVILFLEFSDE